MELSFLDLKEREIINVFDGKKLGRVIDIVFNNETGIVRGIIVPGDKKIFHRSDDVFIPIEKIKRIGNDVILVGIQREDRYIQSRQKKDYDKNIKIYENYYNQNNNYRYDNNQYFDRNKKVIGNRIINNSQTNVSYDTRELKNNTYSSGQSYVRLKPLERKKYK